MAQFIHSNMDTFLNPNERESFKQMYNLFEQSTVNGCLKDFAIITRNKVMHPQGWQDTKIVSISDFHDLMFESRYLIVQVDLIRKSFIEYIQLHRDNPPKQLQ